MRAIIVARKVDERILGMIVRLAAALPGSMTTVDGEYAVGARESDKGDCPRLRFQSAKKSLGCGLCGTRLSLYFERWWVASCRKRWASVVERALLKLERVTEK